MNLRLSSRFAACVLPLLAICAILPGFGSRAAAAEVNATFTSAATVPVTAASYAATGTTLNLALNFAPTTGTNLTVVNNTGLDLSQGTFTNLAQGQRVNLAFNGILYPFVATYFGGTGNDLVLEWGNTRLMAWGDNGYGQMGASSWAPNSLVPVPVDLTGNLNGGTMTLMAGLYHSMAMGPDGSLFAWGQNGAKQLAIGHTIDQFKPVAVSPTGGLVGKRVVAFDTGDAHSLALCDDGTLVAWGRSSNGQMGRGTDPNYTYPDSAPVLVNLLGVLNGRKVLAIAAGGSYNVALCEGGVVAAWGANSYGQVGNGTSGDQFLPAWVSATGGLAGKTVATIAAGANHCLALNTDGSLASWGYNSKGQLGDGTTGTNRLTPVAIPRTGVLAGKTVASIAGGYEHSLVLCTDGTLVAWGSNSSGQLGDGTTTDRTSPVLVNRTGVLAGKTVVAIAAGHLTNLALCSDGSIAAWGASDSGQLGNNSTVNSKVPVLVQGTALTADGVPTKISMGRHGLALVAIAPPPLTETLAATAIGDTTATLNGSVNANGSPSTVVFEYGPTTAYGTTIPAEPATVSGTTATPVSALPVGLAFGSTYHFRVVASGPGGTAYGPDQTFTTTDSAALVGLVFDPGTLLPTFASKQTSYTVSVASDVSSAAVTATVLHDGATVTINGVSVASGAASPAIPLAVGNTPVTVAVTGAGGLTQIYRISVNRLPSTLVFESAAIAPISADGYLATGKSATFALNFAPPTGTTLTVVNNTGAAPIQGEFSNLAQNQLVTLAYQGVNYPWLVNYRGGDDNDLVLEWANRRIVAWGNNASGQLGDGTTTNRLLPTPVSPGVLAGKTLTRVMPGSSDNLVLCADGTAATFGKTPVWVDRSGEVGGRTIVGIGTGMNTKFGWSADGAIFGWGSASSGELGNGSTGYDNPLPRLMDRSGVLAGKSVKTVAGGYYHTLVLCTDGTVAGCGDNERGQLGDGTFTDRTRPVLPDRSGVLAGKTITAIAVGYLHNLALCSDGTLAAWGSDEYGQLGTPTVPPYPYNKSTPALVDRSGVLAGKTICAIAAGGYHSLALCTDGTLAAWGRGTYGQLGNGLTNSASTPVLVNRSGVLAGKTIVGMSLGETFSCVICADGTVATWGSNPKGELGDNSTTTRNVPVLVNRSTLVAGEQFLSVSTKYGHVAALTALPPPPTVEALAATPITDTAATLRAAVNANGTAATLVMEYGLTTDYGSTAVVTPATVTGAGATPVSAPVSGLIPATSYHYRVVATSAGGTVKGEDLVVTTTAVGTLANLTPSDGALVSAFDLRRLTYQLTVPNTTAALRFTPETNHPDATVQVNGEVVASGASSPELPLVAGPNAVTVRVAGPDAQGSVYQITVTRLPAVLAFSSAATVPVTVGELRAVGDAVFSLGFPPAVGSSLTVVNNTGSNPISGRFDNLAQWQGVDLTFGGISYPFIADYYGGTGNDLVLRWAPRRVMAWGDNASGQLGDGTTTNRLVPTAQVASKLNGRSVVMMAAGATHSLALCAGGSLFAWGQNGSGQLGTGDTGTPTVAVQVDTEGELLGKTIVSIAAAEAMSFAVCSDGSLMGWGNGYGSLPTRVSPGGVFDGKFITAIACGLYHRQVLCSDGTIFGWGSNYNGCLGDGTTYNGTVASPVQVKRDGLLAGKRVIAIAAGGYFSLALCDDGTLASWGDGSSSQLGNGGTTNSSVPVAVTRSGVLAGKAVKSIAAGASHSLVRCTDGTLASWGYGSNGQLGNGATTTSSVPVLVNASGALLGKLPALIAAGANHSICVCTDGTTVAWGLNDKGQLGDNSTTNRNVPVKIANVSLQSGEVVMGVTSGVYSDTLAIVGTLLPPTAETLAATAINDGGATINGRVSGCGNTNMVSFEYGTTVNYGLTIASVPSTVSGAAETAVAATLYNLVPGATYHFRVVATGPGGVVKGADQVLITTDTAKLLALTISGAPLVPTFASGVVAYDATVASTTTAVTVTPVAAGSVAEVRVNGEVVASGAASTPVALVEGGNPITVVVTSTAGDSRSYDLVVTRLPGVFAFDSATTVPVSAAAVAAGGLTAEFNLGFAPVPGTRLTVLNNTGGGPIGGAFANLAQWQVVNLTFNGITYPFVADYTGGTGNDLVLEWQGRRLAAWGNNSNGTLGDGTTTSRLTPVPVAGGALAGKALLRAAGNVYQSLALAADGTLASWGGNSVGQLGAGDTLSRTSPYPVDLSGVLAGKVVTSVASGWSFCLALCADGTVAAWGENNIYQLGDGTNTNRLSPVKVGGLLDGKRVSTIACGKAHSLVLCADGTLAGWGDNSSGQLGDGSQTNRSAPVRVKQTGVLLGKTVSAMACGDYSSLLLCTDGSLVNLGVEPTLVDRGVLVGKTVTAIASGANFKLALCADGTLAAWGTNSDGQLGDGTTTTRSTPVLVNRSGVLAGKSVVSIACGAAFSAAVCADGTVATWGYNYSGQLGNNSTTYSSNPVLVTNTLATGERITGVACGATHCLALVAQPLPATVTTLAATEVGDATAALNGEVNANGSTAAVSFEYGLTTAYGSSVAATLGTVTGTTSTPVSAAISGLLPGTTYHFRAVATVTGRTAYGVDLTFTTTQLAALASLTANAGTLAPPFSPAGSQFDLTTYAEIITLTPVTTNPAATVMVNGDEVTSGTAGPPVGLDFGATTIPIVVAEPGGLSRTYQVVVTRLPATLTFDSAASVPATAAGFSVGGLTADLALGFLPVPGTRLMVLKNTGTRPIQGAFANLAQNQIVRLTYGEAEYPMVVNYQGGDGNDLVLDWGVNRLVGWGYNSVGQLGDGTTDSRSVPTPVLDGVLAGKTVSRIVGGPGHAFAFCTDGALAAWGWNGYGQLGDGSLTNRLAPVWVDRTGVLAGKTITLLAGGTNHTVAVCADGALAAWGVNSSGELGDGTTTDRSKPVAVKMDGALAGRTVKAVGCGVSHTLALCTDGTLVAWGYNNYGQLGNGSTTNSTSPVAIPLTGALTGKAITAISAGQYFSLAACADGTVAAWGLNNNGQLGNGTTTDSSIPVAVTRTGVLAGKTVTAISAGETCCLALCSDGTLVAWGSNSVGQLGNGTTTNSSVPVLVTRTGVLAGKAVTSVSVGQSHALVVCADGTVATWGKNSSGQLGDNSTTNRSVPVLVNTSGIGAFERIAVAQAAGDRSLAMVAVGPAPMPKTLAATGISGTNATLTGRVSPNGTTASVAFEYGLTSAYGSTATATPPTVGGSASTAVIASLTRLAPGATYHYRLVVTSGTRSFKGEDKSFTADDLLLLTAVELSAGQLTPAVDSGRAFFHATVPNAVTAAALTPTASRSDAVVKINGEEVASGTASQELPLAVGNNSVTLSVTGGAETVTYQVVVTRLPASFALASAATVPVSTQAFEAVGEAVFSLGFAPTAGTTLTVVNNVGTSAIQGVFSNLVHGQVVNLSFGGIDYPFVADYQGGTGNDLVLVWGNRRMLAWGSNTYGQLGDGTLAQRNLPTPVLAGELAGKTVTQIDAGNSTSLALCADGTLAEWGSSGSLVPKAKDLTGVLAGKTITTLAQGSGFCLALCSDGTLAAWGDNTSGKLGDGSGNSTYRSTPVLVDRSGVLAGKTVTAIAAGDDHSLALCSDGTLVAWGNNIDGRLGDGTTEGRSRPVRVNQSGVLAGKTITAIGAGSYHSVALCSDSTLAAWGYTDSGRLGNNYGAYDNLPVLVVRTGVLAGKTITAIAVGGNHTLALCSDSTLAAWGSNLYGPVGNDSGGNTAVPVLVIRTGVLAGKTIRSILAGGYHSMALCTDGTLASWGSGSQGMQGDNTTAESYYVPGLVNTSSLRPGEAIQSVSLGSSHVLALITSPPPALSETLTETTVTDTTAILNGRVDANGAATTVRFEYGLTTSYGTTATASPASVSGTNATPVSAAISGLRSGTIYHFRVMASGPGGDIPGPDSTFTTSTLADLAGLVVNTAELLPAFDPNQRTYAATVASSSVTITPTTAQAGAVATVNGVTVASGTASEPIDLAIGANPILIGVTGAGGVTQTYQVVVNRLPETFAWATAGAVPARADGFAVDGVAANFALGFAPVAGTDLLVLDNTGTAPIRGRFSNLRQWQTVDLAFNGITYPLVANYHGGTGNDLVLQWANGRLVGWGQNYYGQVNGDMGTTSPLSAVPVAEGVLAGKVVMLASGGASHSVALCADGTLAAWGRNDVGQLGDGTTVSHGVPAPVDTSGVLAGKSIVVLASGSNHTLALCDDGTVAGWGSDYGKVPVVVPFGAAFADKTITSIAAGGYHNLACFSDGTMAAWGLNNYGQLGDGSLVNRTAPVVVDRSGVLAGKIVSAITCGGAHSLALCADGTLVAWGRGEYGRLGNGTTVDSKVPVLVNQAGVLAGKTVTRITPGSEQSFALCSDGTLTSWGYGYLGQLGDATSGNASVPGLVDRSGVLLGKTITAVAAGDSVGFALCADGFLAGWGSSGSLGDGQTASARHTPVAVLTPGFGPGERFGAVFPGGSHAIARVVSPPKPGVATLAATAVADDVAMVHGTAVAGADDATAAFEYGLTTAYGSVIAAVPTTVTGTTATAVSADLTGLTAGATYHFRTIATGPGGTAKGADQTFATSDFAVLAGLTIQAGTLTPGFDSNVFSYRVMVSNETSALVLTPVTSRPESTLEINGEAAVSGAPSAPQPLKVGDNPIAIQVAGAEGNTRLYQLTVHRLPAVFTFASATTVPAVSDGFVPNGLNAAFALEFAPPAGTTLKVLDNTGTGPIPGRFANLAQWQTVTIPFGGIAYPFVANYYGGTGNDLVLEWAGKRLMAWGNNPSGQLGDGTTLTRYVPVPVAAGVLAGKTVIRIAAGQSRGVALASDGTLAQWGVVTTSGSSTVNQLTPVAVDTSGVLAGKTILAIASGGSHSLALCTDGTLAAWGANGSGQLGDGTTTSRPQPVLVDRSGILAGKMIVSLACGSLHSLALCADGTLAGWGSNNIYQLGDGTSTARLSPVVIGKNGVLAGKSIVGIAAGSKHSLAWCADGALAAWGDNESAKLGDGTITSRSAAVWVNRSGAMANKPVVSAIGGESHSVALCAEGTIAAWGAETGGRLGNGVDGSSYSPNPAMVKTDTALSGETVVGLGGGSYHSMALCADGSLAGWGYNSYGQLGIGSTSNALSPTAVSTAALNAGERFSAVAGGENHTIALVATLPPPVPITLAADSLGDATATLNGTLNASGSTATAAFEYGLTSNYGFTATATPTSATGAIAVPVSLGLTGLLPGTIYHFRATASGPGGGVAGDDRTFTTTSLATLVALTAEGAALHPAVAPAVFSYQVTVPFATSAIALTPTASQAGASIRVNGAPVASGTASESRPLAVGSNPFTVVVTAAGGAPSASYMVEVARLPERFVFDSASSVPLVVDGLAPGGHSAELVLNFAPIPGTNLTLVRNTGAVAISGAFANLAQGQKVNLVFNGTSFPFVADYFGGTGNDLVLRWANQRLVAWGVNTNGNLGSGNDPAARGPVAVQDNGVLRGKAIIAVAEGSYHSLALCADGTLATWGGDGPQWLPVAVDQTGVLAGKTITRIAAGGNHSLALCADGTLVKWGTGTAAPVAVDRSDVLAGKTITALAAGYSHDLALCEDGTLVAWGGNNLGQLGDGTLNTRTAPVLVDRSGILAGRTVVAIAAGISHSLALCSDGAVAAWGENTRGQLGDNTTTTRTAPVLSRSGPLLGKQITAIAAGYSHSLVLCADGTLAAWGSNTYGQLGDGTVSSMRTPTLVNRSGALAGQQVLGIRAGLYHSLALCADGSLVGWGKDDAGQLAGAGTSRNPVVIDLGTLANGPVTALSSADVNLALVAAPPPPLAATFAATAILDTGATLNGSAQANGNLGAAIRFEYGLTTAYGSSVSATPATLADSTPVAASAEISGLTAGTTYHFRAIVAGSAGLTAGEDRTFTTTTYATLAGLTLSQGDLSPAFSGLGNDYQVTVPFGAAQLVLTPTLAHTDSAVTVNGVATASGTPSAPVGLTVGQSVIPVVVTAADGLNLRTYTVAVTRLPETFVLDSPDTPPFQADEFDLSGHAPSVSLGFAPQPGTILTLLDATGSAPLRGRFSDLPQGAKIALDHGGNTYSFVANYSGGSGNDLVLEWANRRLLAWGDNNQGKLGIGGTTDAPAPAPVTMTGVLAGKTVIATAMGRDSALALCSDGTLAAWGDNSYGQLGNDSTSTVSSSPLPVLVDTTGVLAGKTVVQIAAGRFQNLALCDDGTLVAWGENSSGQLGDGTMTNRSVPVRVNQAGVLSGKWITAIGCGYVHSMALCADGTLAAWGDNFYGQLGVGISSRSSSPVRVDLTAAAGQPVVGFAACSTHALALTADGTLLAWGNNSNGQLGDGNSGGSQTKATVVRKTGALAGKAITRVFPGYQSSLVGCADGSVVGWGPNSSGQLGNGTTNSVLVPMLVDRTGVLAGKTVLGVAGGETHTVAWCDDFSVAAWGYNSQGQTGTGQANNLIPTAVNLGTLIPGERMIRVSSNYLSNMAIADLPLPLVTGMAATAVSGTGAIVHGTVNAWQNAVEASFEFGLDETYGSTATATPAEITGMADTPVSAALTALRPGSTYHYRVVGECFDGVVRSSDMTFTTLSDNALLAGLGHDGGVIAPGFEKQRFEYLSSVPFETAAVTVSAVTDHPRATVTVNGGSAATPMALTVGNNLITVTVTAEDGITTKTYYIVVNRLPQEFVFNGTDDIPLITDGFAAGGNPVRVVLGFAPAPGTVLTMVNNTSLGFIYGRFGNLAQGQRVTLTYSGTSYDFIANYHGGTGNDLVLQWADTQLLAWGGNGFGQLGDHTTTRRLLPTPVDSAGVLADKAVLAVAGGYLHSLALCADGTLAAWGYNAFGQLGNDSAVPSGVPVAVDRTGALAGKTVVAVAAGPFHNLALCSDGTVAAWGYNNYGQLGDGGTVTRLAPVRVNPVGALAGKQVVAVAAGSYYSFALCDDGTVAAWGYNDEGELGNSGSTTSLAPVAVTTTGALSGKRVAALATGQYHTLALCTDGTLVAWGYNNRGQLGNNSTTSSSQPVAIGSFGALAGKTPVSIGAGAYHSLARCTDGSVAAWGANNLGQLGTVGITSSAVPVAVNLAAMSEIAAGGSHSVALGADGTLFAWGDNADGQLGDNSTTSRAAPAAVDFSAVAAGTRVMAVASSSAARHSLALVALAAPTGKAVRQTTGSAATSDDLLSVAFGSNSGQFPQPLREGDDFVIRFTQPAGATGIRYGAEWSATLLPGSWAELPDTGTGNEHCFSLPAGGQPRGFMRLKVTRE